jgi:uncharacterized protein
MNGFLIWVLAGLLAARQHGASTVNRNRFTRCMKRHETPPETTWQALRRWPWLLLAWLCLALAALGVLLPGLPTTPFVLVAAWAAARGSPRLNRWLHAHRIFGPIIRDWQAGGAVSRGSKWLALATMLLCAAVLVIFAPHWAIVAVGCGSMVIIGTWLWLRPEPRAVEMLTRSR